LLEPQGCCKRSKEVLLGPETNLEIAPRLPHRRAGVPNVIESSQKIPNHLQQSSHG
jgi:hypothetical protein